MLVANSVSLLASDKETPQGKTVQQKTIQETLTTNTLSYTDLAAQVFFEQPVKYTRPSEQAKQLDPQADILQKTDLQTAANQYGHRTHLETLNQQELPARNNVMTDDDDSNRSAHALAYLAPYSSDDEDHRSHYFNCATDRDLRYEEATEYFVFPSDDGRQSPVARDYR